MPLLDGRLLTASLKYIAVNNHWMPGQLLVTFVTAANDSTVPNLTDQMGPVRRPQLPHEGSVRLVYSDYAVNTGLGDDLFKEPEREQKRK